MAFEQASSQGYDSRTYEPEGMTEEDYQSYFDRQEIEQARREAAAAAADLPFRLYRRKLFTGYYKLMTMEEYAKHLEEYSEEYAMLREDEANNGRPTFPDLTEEEDMARFTPLEMAMTWEDTVAV